MEKAMDQHHRIELRVHAGDPPEAYNVGDRLDLDTLMGKFTDHAIDLGRGEAGSVVVEVKRTHEWELVVGLVLAGGAAFVTAAAQELGKRVAGWLADQALAAPNRPGGPPASPGPPALPEVRAEGGTTVAVEVASPAASSDAVAQLFEQAARLNLRLTLVVEPSR